jgi:hypothetical protein
MQWLRRKPVIVCIILAACLAAGIAAGLAALGSSKRRAVERDIGAALPRSAEELNHHIHQLGTDLYAHHVYIKFRASKQDYMDLMRRMGVPTFDKEEPDLRILLPGQWKPTPLYEPDWWDPSPDIPDGTAMMYEGSAGWIIAKHENGYVYIVIWRPIR